MTATSATTIRVERTNGKLRPVCPKCGDQNLKLQNGDEAACGTCATVHVVDIPTSQAALQLLAPHREPDR